MFTELQSGSNLLLGVHSIPKSCENSVDPPPGGGVLVGSEKSAENCHKMRRVAVMPKAALRCRIVVMAVAADAAAPVLAAHNNK